MATLLTNIEAIDLANIGKEFPPCDIQSIIQVELTAFNNCLSIDFYNSLLSALVDYSSVVKWANTTAYNTNDLVSYNGRIYKALQGSTGVQPMAGTYWQIAPKFSNTTLNNLWTTGLLGRWLALLTIGRTIPYMANQITGKGIVKNFGQDYQAAGVESVNGLQSRVSADAIDCLNIVKLFIKNNPDFAWVGLDGVQGCGCEKKSCGKSKGFRVC